MQNSVHQGRVFERKENGTSTTETVTGNFAEMQTYLAALVFDNTSGGRHVVSGKVSQVAGPEWKCEVVYADESNGGTVTAPSSAYGKKSATLNAGILRMPLEHHEKYLANWNYYLVQGIRTGGAVSVPAWWETATTVILDKTVSQTYKWVKSLAEIPIGADKMDREWMAIKEPTKPGVEGYDLATYQVTESVKQPNPTRCGSYVAGRLNKIIRPNETFGLAEGNWKCDSASIQWDGKCWKATLTYTKSGDSAGWDKDLYANGDRR